jgi:hypothetical protein
MFSVGSEGSCLWVNSSWSLFVTTNVFAAGITPWILASVFWIIVPEPVISRNCFGDRSRLFGQNRDPTPPAMMTA